MECIFSRGLSFTIFNRSWARTTKRCRPVGKQGTEKSEKLVEGLVSIIRPGVDNSQVGLQSGPSTGSF